MSINSLEQKEFYAAGTIREATKILSQQDATVISGGQSLLPLIRQGKLDKSVIVDISGIDAYDSIKMSKNGLTLGGLLTYHDLIESEVSDSPWAILSEASKQIADRQVRNWGTIGGAVAYGDPTYDLPPALIAFDAQLIATEDGETTREYSLDGFYPEPFDTQLAQEELIINLKLPAVPNNTGAAFEKHAFRKGDKSLVNLSVRLSADDDGTINEARLCVGCVVPTPTRLRELEDALVGTDIEDRDARNNIANRVNEYIDPVPEAHASASYQIQLVENMTATALQTASERALEDGQ
jgi:CO/xanthine dehydrogenase FAD-binding subunit